MNSRTRRVILNPTPGFVVKTTNEEPGIYTPKSLPPQSTPTPNTTLEPSEPLVKSTPVTKGFKIFLNVAYDDGVPPPPKSSEPDIRKAMMGEEINAYFVPVIVSDGREVTDKAGKPCLVFDTIFNPSLRARVTSDADFKTFITEIALERVEEKSGLILGREIATPNIKSKGALESRSVLIPSYWSPETTSTSSSNKPLVQEIPTPASSVPASILPPTSVSASPSATGIPPKTSTASTISVATSDTKQTPPVPTWAIEIENKGPGSRVVRITIQLPLMKRSDHANTTLDMERNRLILSCPPSYGVLDVPILDPSSKSGSGKSPSPPLPPTGLDVERVKAEWRVQENTLVITAPVVSTATAA